MSSLQQKLELLGALGFMGTTLSIAGLGVVIIGKILFGKGMKGPRQ